MLERFDLLNNLPPFLIQGQQWLYVEVRVTILQHLLHHLLIFPYKLKI